MTTLKVDGPNCKDRFLKEAGGHRWQRVPPTERNGRVHTSTITVAVVDSYSNSKPDSFHIPESDLDWKYTRSGGNGGQKTNKTSSAVILTHLPSKMQIRCEQERNQHRNKQIALQRLKERLHGEQSGMAQSAINQTRKDHVGSGQRGDKIRTISVKNDSVKNDLNGKKTNVRRYLAGEFEDIV